MAGWRKTVVMGREVGWGEAEAGGLGDLVIRSFFLIVYILFCLKNVHCDSQN